jgi:protein O-GlcNAc transferase
VDPGAELRQGVTLQRQGRLADAERCFARVLELDPSSFEALHMLGLIAAQTGRSARAVELLTRAISLNQSVGAAHEHLGIALQNLGRQAEALASLERALALRPDSAPAHVNLSALLLEMGRAEAALASADRALELAGNFPPAHINRAAALRALGRGPDALTAYDRVIALEPRNAMVRILRGDLLLSLDAAMQALESYRGAWQLQPEMPEAPGGCSVALLSLGRAGEALAFAQRALALRPDSAHARAHLAAVYLALKRPQEARAAYERALALRADSLEALCGLARAHYELGARAAARDAWRRALALEPDCPPAHAGLLVATIPVIAASADEIAESRQELAAELTRFETWALGRTLDEPAIVSLLPPFYLAYQERANRELLVGWGALCARLMHRWAERKAAPEPVGAASDGRIRLGIVTAHAFNHSVFRALIGGWLACLDPQRVHISLFHLGAGDDSVTAAARTRAELIDCAGRSLEECVRAIRERRIDVLLYPEVGMDGMTLALASLRLARHQLASWGHPETTGLPTIDYFLSAAAFEPADADRDYCETLIRLPGIGCYYQPWGIESRDGAELPEITPGVPLLLCAGLPYKYAAEYDSALIEIARELGPCQIVFFEAPQEGLSRRLLARLEAGFHAAGLDPRQYLRLVPWMSLEGFATLMRRADVYLDSLGFSGFNTTMQAVECALPIVAYQGRFMRGRFASGILEALGLQELVAQTTGDYVRHAVALARNPERRAAIRERLATERHRLYGDRAAVDALTGFLTGLPR